MGEKHKIRVYRGDTIIGHVVIDDKYYGLFNDILAHDGELRPCVNLVDELYSWKPESADRYEFQKVMHFDLTENPK